MDIVYHDIKRKFELDSFLSSWLNSEKYIACNTSGSTSKAKTILLSKEKMRISALKTISYFNLSAESKIGLALSCETIAGKMMVVRAMEAKMQLHVLPLSTNPLYEIFDKLDFISLIPAQVLSYIESKNTIQDSCIFLIGGAPVSDSMEKVISQKLKKAYQSYGMTETYSHVAMRHLIGENQSFQAMENISFQETNGCLQIRAKEYFDEPLLTNDLVDLIDEFSFYFKGRADFAINSGGIKIHPEQVENKLEPILTDACMIVPIPHEKFGEVIGILVTNQEDCTRLHALEQLHVLSKNEMPRFYQQIPYFRATLSGKIDRKANTELIDKNAWKSLL